VVDVVEEVTVVEDVVVTLPAVEVVLVKVVGLIAAVVKLQLNGKAIASPLLLFTPVNTVAL